MVDKVFEVVSGETVIQGYQDSSYLRDRVERFELRTSVGRDIRDSITGTHPELLSGR
jgi:hypothetical protein